MADSRPKTVDPVVKSLIGVDQRFDVRALILSLIGAPCVITAIFSVPLLITVDSVVFWLPLLALVMGFPVYVLVGAPALYWYVSQSEPRIWVAMAMGLASNCVASALIWIADALLGSGFIEFGLLYLFYGSIFAPVWAGGFAWGYLKLRRPHGAAPPSQ